MYGQLMELNWPHVAFVYRISACNLPVEEKMEAHDVSVDRRRVDKSANKKGNDEIQQWLRMKNEEKGHMLQ